MKIDFKGNRWYKCDFHLHTPASECFTDKSITPEQFIEKVIERGLDCISVTDHNSVEWIDKIRNEGNEKGITVFPGVEITCSDSKIHLLVLFDIDVEVVRIQDFMRDAGIKREDFGKQTAHSIKSVIEVAKIASESGAIVIPAHVDSYSGLANTSYQIQKDFLNLKTISAVQMVNKELIIGKKVDIKKEELYLKLSQADSELSMGVVGDYVECSKLVKDREYGILTFSDNPESEGSSKHGLWGIGKEYSWIKMDESPRLESLRQAMLFPSIRIKTCYEEDNSKVNKLPDLWIKSIYVKDIEVLGSKPLEVEFNPQLTAVIGGRGSGKSTIVRLLTAIFAMDNIKELNDLYEEFLSFYKIKTKTEGVLKSTSEIKVEVVRNSILYKVIAKNFSGSNSCDLKVEKYDSDSQIFVPIDESVEDLFRVDIYNQKQIYKLAQNTNSLRDKVDSMIDSIESHKKEANMCMSRYKIQYSKIREIEMSLSSKRKLSAELNDISEKIDTYRQSGIKDLLQEYEIFNKEYILLSRFAKDLDEKINLIDNFKEEFSRNSEVIDLSAFNDNYNSELNMILEGSNKEFYRNVHALVEIKASLEKLKFNYMEGIKGTNWYKDYIDLEKRYNDKINILKDMGVDIERISVLLKNKEEKQNELDILERKESQLKDEYGKLGNIKDEYIKLRELISNERAQFTRKLLEYTNIKIKIKKFRDYDNFIFKFREILQKPSGFNDEIDEIAKKCFERDIKRGVTSLIEEIKSVKYDNMMLFRGKFNKVINSLNDEQIAELQLLLPEDDIQIEYKPNNSSGYKSLQNASAGQRTSAILTFILADGIVPLILDQPEDDLDNHLIYDLVVERVKECKEKRQIIVITHNANIPVNGDAELIIAMNSDSKNIEVFKQGTIEDNKLRDEICNVMEGGEKAFLMRANRYSLLNI
ncbi:TrlF family AAA-like ATPase [Clostridium paridis]|uniref:PHP domain-containing protein n=1 Tax=Clostridium paridis TaxID=2803863 RepID=A0A937K5H8_9CLOT|nr:PHP domain-containing protein [Clostridium paridis]MBL4933044.1 PHP domain-containing protein [Clostridium paridis]